MPTADARVVMHGGCDMLAHGGQALRGASAAEGGPCQVRRGRVMRRFS